MIFFSIIKNHSPWKNIASDDQAPAFLFLAKPGSGLGMEWNFHRRFKTKFSWKSQGSKIPFLTLLELFLKTLGGRGRIPRVESYLLYTVIVNMQIICNLIGQKACIFLIFFIYRAISMELGQECCFEARKCSKNSQRVISLPVLNFSKSLNMKLA